MPGMRLTCWKNLRLNSLAFSDRNQLGGPNNATQCVTITRATVSADIESGTTVLTSFVKLSKVTKRYLFLFVCLK